MQPKLIFDPNAKILTLNFPEGLSDPLFGTILQRTLGFIETDQGNFSLDVRNFSNPRLYEVTRKVVKFVTDQKLKFIPNDEAQKLILRAQDDLEKRMKVKVVARALLKKSVTSENEVSSASFKRELKPYQEDPARFMATLPYTANFSVPGSGKTAMVYAAYSRMKELGVVQKMLVIGPSSAYLAWSEEYQECFEKKPKLARITGTKHKRNKLYEKADRWEIFITTYQMATMDVDHLLELLKSSRFLLVLDESHNIKKFEEGMWASAVLKLAEHAYRKIILTGTPVPNKLQDLWTQFNFLEPDILGTKGNFKSFVQKPNAEKILRKKLAPFYRRVKKKDLDLPEPVFRIIKVKAKKLQSKIYEAIRKASLEELKLAKEDKFLLSDLRRAIIIRLMQAASNPSLLIEKSEEFQIPAINQDKIVELVESSVVEGIRNYSKFEVPSKIEAAEKITRNILKNHPEKKVLIWSVWVNNLKMLSKQLRDLNPIVIYGDVPINEEQDPLDNRELRIKRFKTNPSSRVMIANPGACGESISLHDVCHDAIYLDRTFNAGQYMQSLDRIHRVGLKKTDKITYHILLVKDTIDETINRRLEEKKDRMLRLLNDDFQVINLETELSEVSGVPEDEETDFDAVMKDLKRKDAKAN